MAGWLLFSASVGCLAAVMMIFVFELYEDVNGLKRSPRWHGALAGFAAAFVPLAIMPLLIGKF